MKQMLVKDFIKKYVKVNQIQSFMAQLRKWDEGATMLVFYDLDILQWVFEDIKED